MRLTINGKRDFSMTGRRARSYTVLDYVLVELGEARAAEVRSAEALEEVKRVPLEEARHVDLRERMY